MNTIVRGSDQDSQWIESYHSSKGCSRLGGARVPCDLFFMAPRRTWSLLREREATCLCLQSGRCVSYSSRLMPQHCPQHKSVFRKITKSAGVAKAYERELTTPPSQITRDCKENAVTRGWEGGALLGRDDEFATGQRRWG